MGWGEQPKRREYKVTVTAMLDDATKYDEVMDSLCTGLLKEIKAIFRDPTGRIRVEVERLS